jgi:intracellular multiplication protein IcmE
MAELDNKKGFTPKNGTVRILISLGIAAVVCVGSVYAVHYHRTHRFTNEMSVGGSVNVPSIPGSGETSDAYINDQQKQNSALLHNAESAGISAIPTITSASFRGAPEAFLAAGEVSDKACPAAKENIAVVRDPNSCTVANLIMARKSGVMASELLCQGCTCPVLKDAGYTAGELKQAGFSAKTLHECGYSLQTLVDAGFSAGDLAKAGFSAKQLHDAGFSASQLKDAGFSVNDLKAAGFTAAELKNAGFSASDLKSAGFTPAELKKAGFSASDLKSAGFTAAQLNQAGFTAADLAGSGFSKGDLIAAGYSAADINGLNNNKACSVDALKKARANGVSALELKNQSCSAAELKAAGYTPAELKQAGYSAKQLLDAGFSPSALKAAGFSAKELKDAGVSAAELKAAGYSAKDLAAAGFSARQLHDAGFSAGDLKDAGFSALALKKAGFSAGDLHAAGYSAKDLLQAGFNPQQLRSAGVSAAEMKLAGLSPNDLKAAGYTDGDLLRAGFQPADLAGNSSAETGGVANTCSVAHIQAEKAAGFSATKIAADGCSISALHNAGFNAAELAAAGFTPAQLAAANIAGAANAVNASSSKNLTCSADSLTQARANGVSVATIISMGCSVGKMKTAGFTNDELAAAGVTPAQLQAADQAVGIDDGAMSANTLAMPQQIGTAAQRAAAQAQAMQNLQLAEAQQLNAAQAQQQLQEAQTQMQSQASQLLDGWNKVSTQSYQTVNIATASNDASGGAGSINGSADTNVGGTIKAGDIMFAVLDTSIDTDVNSPIMASIVAGPFTGSKLLGSFVRANDMVTIKFNLLSVKGYDKSIPLNAVAIDGNTAHTAVNGYVNHHYLLRYGSLFASSFINGFAQALSATTTTCLLPGIGCVTQPQNNAVTTQQQVEMGLGQVGQSYAANMSDNFHRDPTVKIPQGTGVGVLFMQDLQLPSQLKPLYDKYNKSESKYNG